MKNKHIVTILLIAILGLLIYDVFFKTLKTESLANTALASDQLTENKQAAKDTTNPYRNAELKVALVNSDGGTFGYDVLLNGSPLVHQPTIPGMPGNAGFKTKEKATKVAEFVISKIRKNQMPPTVSAKELDSLKVLK